MPKIIRPGSKPPQYAPPPGLQYRCTRCGAELETVEDEQVFKSVTRETAPDMPWKMGWRIPCPCCAENVFVEEPEPVHVPSVWPA